MKGWNTRGTKIWKNPVKGLGLCILASSLFFNVCSGAGIRALSNGKSYIKPESEFLEVNGDSITITINGSIPAKFFNKKGIIKVEPSLTYGEHETFLKPIILKGEKVKEDYPGSQTVTYATGLTFHYMQKVAYTPEMKNSLVSIDYNAKMISKYEDLNQCKSAGSDTLMGAITTSLSVKRTDDIYQKFHDGDKSRTSKTVVSLLYEVNDAELGHHIYKGQDPKEKELRNLEEANIQGHNNKAFAQLKEYVSNNKIKIDHVVLRCYASPDGDITRNAELCKLRSENAEMVLRNEFSKMGLSNAYDSTFIKRPDKDDDWAGFKALVEKSNMADKANVLSIINSSLDYDSKNEALRKLSSWQYLRDSVLPLLRRSEVVINGTFPMRTYEETAETPLDELSPGEVLNVALNTKDTAKKMEIYQYYYNKYPDDWAGYNDYAAMLLYTQKDNEAYKILSDLAKKYPDNDTIINNLGVANRYLHHYDAAKENYKIAQKGGINEDNNLGILDIKYGHYASAIAHFNKTQCDYNVALAYCLNKDYEEALNKISHMGENASADAYYLKAVVYAREKNKPEMLASLTEAFNRDIALEDKTKADLEFHKFIVAPEFLSVVNQKPAANPGNSRLSYHP